MHPADPLGSLTPAEVPLIEAEKLSEQAGPPHLTRLRKLTFWNNDWEKAVDFSAFNILMDYRDRVMHSADIKMLDRNELMSIHAKVKSLAYFVSIFLERE